MINPIEALFGAGLLPRTDFPPESRYHGLPVQTRTGVDGVPVVYLTRRFVPAPERFATVGARTVKQGERLDRTAAQLTGDPERFWTLCDANGVIWPAALEAEGAVIRVTLPVDVPSNGGGER